MSNGAAPAALHDCLDVLYQAALVGKNIGMGTQLILSVDKDGNLGEMKVNMTGKAAAVAKAQHKG